MSNPYVFIVGCPRSGTTLLQRIADAHPQLAITAEAQWIPRRFKERNGVTAEGWVLPELIPQLFEHSRFMQLELRADEVHGLLGTEERVSYAEFVARVFDLYGQRRGKALVGNKTPGFVRRLENFHKLWPKARFVHLIRDGRDVCLSMAQWAKAKVKHPGDFTTWKDDPISTTALWWDLNVRLGRRAGRSLGPELYYEVHYESLISNPEQECAALCAFLGLPYNTAMLRFHEGRTKSDPALNTKDAWLPITPGLRNWKTQMLPEDVERFEATAGELLEELGYARSVSEIRPESAGAASRIRELLAHDAKWVQAETQREAGGLRPEPRISHTQAGNRNLADAVEGGA